MEKPITEFDDVNLSSLRIDVDTEQSKIVDEDELIVSAHVSTNAAVFPKILTLHVKKGAKIADVTYGNGVFWKNVDTGPYTVYASDVDPDKSPSGLSIDCRNLPYKDSSLDVVVLDPPYAEGFYRENDSLVLGNSSDYQQMADYYGGDTMEIGGSKYHRAVLDMYWLSALEAKRVLKEDGVLIVKTQDEVSANTQELTHIQITNLFEQELDMYTKDLFVVMRETKPAVSGMQSQVHARKNHSFFMVYEMEGEPVNTVSFS